MTINIETLRFEIQLNKLDNSQMVLSPLVVGELLDQLEAAEAEALEEARLNGMGSEREAALMAKLEAAERERDALRAKVERMEKQEPVAKVESWTNGSYTRHYKLKWLRDVGEGAALYALPGAQPAPSTKDAIIDDLQSQFNSEGITEHDSGDALIRLSAAIAAVEDNFVQPAPSVPEYVMRDAARYRYLRARCENTAGIGCWLEADGKVCERGWLFGDQLDSAIDSFIESLAAAPEAKP